MSEDKKHITKCRTDDGLIYVYDIASSDKNAFIGGRDENKYELIGRGVIWSIDGVIQEGERLTRLYFFRIKETILPVIETILDEDILRFAEQHELEPLDEEESNESD